MGANRETILPFSLRKRQMLITTDKLEKAGLKIHTTLLGPQDVFIFLADSPLLYELKGNVIAVSNPDGFLQKTMEQRFGIVHVQWSLPYHAKLVPPQTTRVQ